MLAGNDQEIQVISLIFNYSKCLLKQNVVTALFLVMKAKLTNKSIKIDLAGAIQNIFYIRHPELMDELLIEKLFLREIIYSIKHDTLYPVSNYIKCFWNNLGNL